MQTDEQGSATGDLARLAAIDLNLLVPLHAILEERSVTRAAARVGVTQPALSHALRRMRRLLGDELVVRHGNTLVLTPHALELAGPLRQMLEQTARVVGMPTFDAATTTRTITVLMTTSTAVVMAAEVARLVTERAPEATLRIQVSPVVTNTDFVYEGVDLALVADAFGSPYPRERLYSDRWVVIAAAHFAPELDALGLLRDCPHAEFDGFGYRMRPYAVLEENGIRPRVRELVSDYLLLPTIVAATRSVAVHRYSVVTALARPGELRIEEFPLPTESLSVDMIWNPWLTASGYRQWLHGLILDAARNVEV